jgi:hypothetical protein
MATAYVIVSGGIAEQGERSDDVYIFDLDGFRDPENADVYSAEDIASELERAFTAGAWDVVPELWRYYRDQLVREYEKQQDAHGAMFEAVRVGIEVAKPGVMHDALKIVAKEFGIEYEGKVD